MESTDKSHVEKIVKTSGTSFFWGMSRLSGHQKRAMFALYAFCRVIDDIADEASLTKNQKLKKISFWEKQINLIFKSPDLKNPLSRELHLAAEIYNLEKNEIKSIIDGMKMDIKENIKFPNRKKFELYCDRVAVAVGLLSIKIFGVNSKEGRKYAFNLGRAFQLTNIVRDFIEDLERKRCYLPIDYFKRYKMQPKISGLSKSPKIQLILQDLLDEANIHFLKAEKISKSLDQKKIIASETMKLFYKKIHKKMFKKVLNFKKKVRLNLIEKLWIFILIIFGGRDN